MIKFLLPITAIASCASIAFTAGTQLSTQPINNTSIPQPPSILPDETTVQPSPHEDLENACQQSNRSDCEQRGTTKDWSEFQARVQRITDRAEDEMTRLKADSPESINEMTLEEPQPLSAEIPPDTEIPVRPQTMQSDLLQQAVTSSLQPNPSINLQPIEAIERNDQVEKNLTTTVPSEDSSISRSSFSIDGKLGE